MANVIGGRFPFTALAGVVRSLSMARGVGHDVWSAAYRRVSARADPDRHDRVGVGRGATGRLFRGPTCVSPIVL